MIKKLDWSIENKLIAAGFSMALCLTSIASFISYQNATELTNSAAQVERAQRIFSHLADIMTILVDVESGRRGYLLFKDRTELQRYQAGSKNLKPKVTQLQQWTIDNSHQQQKLTDLESAIAQSLSISDQSIRLSQQDPTATSEQARLLIENQKNRQIIRQIIAEMGTHENNLIEQSIIQSQLNTRYRIAIEILSTFLSFTILFGTFVFVYRQVLARKQAEIKRQQAESRQLALTQEKELSELKLRFFSMVSHEFRTPLSIILGSAQLLADDDQKWNHEKKIANLERIQSSARSMNQLLTDILTLTRAEAGKLEFNTNLIDVEILCINLIEDIKLCDTKNHDLIFISHSYCPHSQLDDRLMYSILSNLLTNAIKYSPQGSTIELILKCEPSVIIFQVKDQGIGIPLADIPNLYEPFHRASNVGTIGGTGLGLAVVKKCVDLHQGSIFVESKVGVGTTFTVKIPVISNVWG